MRDDLAEYLPLRGIVVLDLSRLLAGSLCGQLLADMGADVIKIEDTETGDGFRKTNPRFPDGGCHFHMVNRNKRGMRLDLKSVEGQNVFKELVKRADVLLGAIRPQIMENWGLDYEHIRKINPQLIYCSLTGFGQDGPYRDYPSHDINLLALSGILGLIGEKNGRPAIPGVQFVGVGGGALQACIGILAALYGRQNSGQGRFLDIALLDGMTPFLSLPMAEHMAGGKSPQRGEGFTGGEYAHYRVYETSDGGFIALGCLEKKYWRNFCQAVGRKDLIDQQYLPPLRQKAVIEEVAAIFKSRTRDEWLKTLNMEDICFSPVNSLAEAMADPQIQHRGLWFQSAHPVAGNVGQQAFPFKFGNQRPGFRCGAPGYGEHSRVVLQEFGFSETEIDDLQDKGVI